MSETYTVTNGEPWDQNVYGDRHMARNDDGTTFWVFLHRVQALNHEIRVAVIPPQYAGITVETVVSSMANPASGYAICCDTDGEAVIAYRQQGSTTTQVYRRESGTWTAKGSFTTFSTGGQTMSIQCDSGGDFYLCQGHYRSGPGTQSAWTRISTDDLVSWGSIQTADSETTSSDEIDNLSRVASGIDKNDVLHMVWAIKSASNSKVPLRYATYNGSWSSVEVIESLNANLATNAPRDLSLAIDEDGVPHVCWVRQHRTSRAGDLAVFYAHRTGGSWSTPQQVHGDGTGEQHRPCITINGHDDLVRVYWYGDGIDVESGYDQVNEGLFPSGGSWSTRRVTSDEFDHVEAATPHALVPECQGYANDGGVVGYYDMSTSGSTTGVGQFHVLDSTVWHCRPTATLSLTASITASISGELAPSATASVFALVSAIAKKENVVEARATTIPTVTALWKDHSRASLTASVTASVLIEKGVSATVTVTPTATANKVLPLLCETTYEPSPAILADPDSVTKVVLSGPFVAPTVTVQLPRPEFGDVPVLDPLVRVHRTMDGDRRAFRLNANVTHKRRRLRWEHLERAKVFELEAFFQANRGRSVRYVDHETHTWRARLLSRSIDFEQVLREHGTSVELELDVEAT